MLTSEQCVQAIEIMGEMFPEAKCELNHQNAFELLVATILSAQATDVSVNKVTPALFQAYPAPEDLANADETEIMAIINSIGLYRNKAKYLRKMAGMLVAEYGGEVPQTREELVRLPGVGRKTANVVLSVAFHIPAIAVDTHVERVTKRLKMVPQEANVLEVEQTLMEKLPSEIWGIAHHRLIFYGRYRCTARKPDCEACDYILRAVGAR
ncbi:endonuclease III [Jeotgalibaca caeni]|uniref:endonuclease III n=1 Tax=Jeotgalibaca caeni TaxID=3028623 RepID=UPI00237E2631|nr:endonuclease III [Jeotgalibaca caeni]MDE1549069.1 endonuclease III [Jeotgalibaca caeni]